MAAADWDRWKTPGADGRLAMELRERALWQSVLRLARPPELVDLNKLARAVRAGYTT